MADIEIQDDFVLPEPTIGKSDKQEKYPFGQLAIGQGFEVDVSHLKNPHGFRTIARGAAARHQATYQIRINAITKRAYVRRSA